MSALTVHLMPAGPRRPLLIMAFSGWNDAAESATTAVRFLSTVLHAEKFAEIDPEEFYHFGLTRPNVRYRSDLPSEREIIWPATEFSIAQSPDLTRDVILGVASEPHLKWRTYCAAVVELAQRCEVGLVLTLGGLLAEVPHTRPVRLSGGSPDPELAARLGVRATRYEGPTGIVGVLGERLQREGCEVLSLWAGLPHYISATPNPRGALALLQPLVRHLGLELDEEPLRRSAAEFEEKVNTLVAEDPELAEYVRELKRREFAQ